MSKKDRLREDTEEKSRDAMRGVDALASLLTFIVRESPAFSLVPFRLKPEILSALRTGFQVKDVSLRFLPAAVDPLLVESKFISAAMLLSDRRRCPECPLEASRDYHYIDSIKPSVTWEPCLRDFKSSDAVVCVPLHFGDKAAGTLVFIRDRVPPLPAAGARALTTVARAVGSAVEIAVLRETNKLMEITDPLTRLYNFRYFLRALDMELERSRRYNHPFALVIFDIDQFRTVNETHGRDAGDRVLRNMAAILRGAVRVTDTLSRYSGEEFALLLPETLREGARATMEKILRKVAKTPLKTGDDGPEVRCMLSAGFAMYPEDSDLAGNLINAAEASLYASKLRRRSSP